jgi:hypothetical protein
MGGRSGGRPKGAKNDRRFIFGTLHPQQKKYRITRSSFLASVLAISPGSFGNISWQVLSASSLGKFSRQVLLAKFLSKRVKKVAAWRPWPRN